MIVIKNQVEEEVGEEVRCEEEREEENYKERKEARTVVRATALKKRRVGTRMISLQVPQLSPKNSYFRYRYTCRTQTLTANKLTFFHICGTVHHHLILIKTTNVMQHVAFVFIMPVVALYMFWVLLAHHQECIETVHADSGTIVFQVWCQSWSVRR